MSLISQVKATEKVVEVEYPEIDGFFISLRYLSREELTKIRSRCLTYKFNKRSHQKEEEVDNDKFLKAYAEKAIAGWRGLKYKHLPELLPVNLDGVNIEEEIGYSQEEALDLLKSSVPFDQFITDAMGDLTTFEDEDREQEEKN